MRISRMIAVLMACVVLVSASAAFASSSQPKTASQCRKTFKSASKQRACIQRVASEKPGASCTHPLKSEYARDGEHLGSRDISTSNEAVPPTNHYLVFIGPHLAPPQVTNYQELSATSDAKVIVCEAELRTYEGPNKEITKRYRLPVGPHSVTPFVIAGTEGAFRLVVFGRYARNGA